MKRAKTSSRKARTGDRKSFARHSSQVRRRAAGFKLEALEERTLLSVTTKPAYPPASVPLGLGTAYTTMSEQAHGVGLGTSDPMYYTGGTSSTSTSNPV